MKGVFVTGTGTGVGKTTVSAWLVLHWEADYWKPVQTGTRDGWDADVIRQVAPRARIHPSAYAFPEPLSPHAAAAHARASIDLEAIRPPICSPAADRLLVVEGAGGVLVPLSAKHLMVDLIVRLELPVVIAADSGLGTINHTLLTVEALRQRRIEPVGVVLNGPADPDNAEAIARYGRTRILGTLPRLGNIDEDLAALPPPAWRPK